MGREHTRSSPWVHRSNPAFPHTMVLTVSSVISPVIGLCCHRRLASAQNLTPASRRQDHTTSPSAFSTVRQRCLIASIASRPASVTIASAPWWDETARLGKCFASYWKQDIFAQRAGQVICETAEANRRGPAHNTSQEIVIEGADRRSVGVSLYLARGRPGWIYYL